MYGKMKESGFTEIISFLSTRRAHQLTVSSGHHHRWLEHPLFADMWAIFHLAVPPLGQKFNQYLGDISCPWSWLWKCTWLWMARRSWTSWLVPRGHHRIPQDSTLLKSALVFLWWGSPWSLHTLGPNTFHPEKDRGVSRWSVFSLSAFL